MSLLSGSTMKVHIIHVKSTSSGIYVQNWDNFKLIREYDEMIEEQT